MTTLADLLDGVQHLPAAIAESMSNELQLWTAFHMREGLLNVRSVHVDACLARNGPRGRSACGRAERGGATLAMPVCKTSGRNHAQRPENGASGHAATNGRRPEHRFHLAWRGDLASHHETRPVLGGPRRTCSMHRQRGERPAADGAQPRGRWRSTAEAQRGRSNHRTVRQGPAAAPQGRQTMPARRENLLAGPWTGRAREDQAE